MEITTNRRRRFSNADKLKLIKSHFSDGVSIDELGRRHAIHPTLLYRWRREFLSSLDSRDELSPSPARALQLRRRIRAIDSRIARLNDDVAYLKKLLDVLDNTSGAGDGLHLTPDSDYA